MLVITSAQLLHQDEPGSLRLPQEAARKVEAEDHSGSSKEGFRCEQAAGGAAPANFRRGHGSDTTRAKRAGLA